MDVGAPELLLILVAILLLCGYKKLPDASRSIGRSLRVFTSKMKGLKDDDGATTCAATAAPTVRSELMAPAATDPGA